MRRSTAAGIYVLQLPQDAAARNSPVGICRKRLAVVLYGKSPLFLVFLAHSAHSVPERASSYTEYTFGAKNRLLLYATHF